MSERKPEIAGFHNVAQTFELDRHNLASGTGEELDLSEERSLLRCLQRLAVVPQVAGLAFSRIRDSGSLYFTVIERRGLSNEKDFKKITDAIYDFGDALGELMPGSFINLPEGENFASAEENLRSSSRASELDLLGIIQFTE